MTKKAALVVTTLLTVFVLVMMMGVMTRLTAVDASAGPSSDAAAQAVPQGAQVAPAAQSGAAPVIDAQLAQQREQIYRQRLDEANAQIQKANEQLRQMQTQNTQMLQREQTYQQRLQEANSRLLRQAASALATSQSTQASPQQATIQPQTTISQQPGQVLTSRQQATQQLASQQMLSPEQAAAIAFQYIGGGRVSEVKLEHEHGAVAYEVKVGGGKVAVDAYNGDVLFSKQEKTLVRDLGSSRLKMDGHDRDDD